MEERSVHEQTKKKFTAYIQYIFSIFSVYFQKMEILSLHTKNIVDDIKLQDEECDRIAEAVDILSKIPTDLTIISNQRDLTNDEISVNKTLLNLVNPSLPHDTF